MSIGSNGSSFGYGNVFGNLSNTLNMADNMINMGGYIKTAQSSTTQQLQAQGMQKAMETSNLRAEYYSRGYTRPQVDDILGVGDGSSGITAANSGSDDIMTTMLMMSVLPQLLGGGDGESSLDPSMLASLFTMLGGTGGTTSSTGSSLDIMSMLGLSSGTTGSNADIMSMLGLDSDIDFSSILGGLGGLFA